MSRQEKNTRIRNLPPILFKDSIQQKTGSNPTKNRTSSDNRTGKYLISYDDTQSYILNRNSDNILYPIGTDLEQSFISGNINDECRFGLLAEGIQTTNIENFIELKNHGQEILPFNDSGNPASDHTKNQFYLTGSSIEDVGFGFSSPLSSKTKIEFNLTPNSTVGFSTCISSNSGNINFPMIYWNNVDKTFNGIGQGQPFETYGPTISALLRFLDEQPIGFGFTTDNGTIPTDLQEYGFWVKGKHITNFGFPYHEKFKPTTNQTISMENFISEPFLLEKIVLFVSCSQNLYPNITDYGATTFFILNERVGRKENETEQTIEYRPFIHALTQSVTSSAPQETYRDLIGSLQISKDIGTGYSDYSKLGANREFVVNNFNFNSQFEISGAIKSSFSFSRGIASSYSGSAVAGNISAFIEKNNKNGRNAIFDRNPRDFLNTFETAKFIGTGSYTLPFTPPLEIQINEKYSKINPYLLFPTDKIIFGWQLPLDITNSSVANLTFSNLGVNKIIMYGSLIKIGDYGYEEKHDTLNQNLNSNIIYEVIG